MKKKTKKILLGSAFAAGLLHSAYRGVTRYMVKAALDRHPPKHTQETEQRLSGGGIDPQVESLLQEAARQLEEKRHQEVILEAHDGVCLCGHWFGRGNAKRVILAMHGWRSGWCHDFGAVANFWLDNDCSVLIPEQRAQGKSGGKYMGFGLLERHDCLSWLHWLNESGCAALPIYLCGISMGAATVLMAAGLELPGNVRGIIADSGYTSPGAVWKHVADRNLGIHFGFWRVGAQAMCKRRLKVGMDDYTCPQAMAVCPVPVLFIHGTDDQFVPVEMTMENYRACTAPKELLLVPGAGHGMSYFVDADAYRTAILKFWERWDPAPWHGKQEEMSPKKTE